MDPAVAPLEYNYRTEERFQEPAERPVLSCFLRVSDRVYRSKSQIGDADDPTESRSGTGR